MMEQELIYPDLLFMVNSIDYEKLGGNRSSDHESYFI